MNAVEKKEGKAGRKEQGFEPFSYFFDTAFLAGLFFVEAFLVELFFVDVFLVDGDLALGDLAAFGLFFALLFLLAGDFLVLNFLAGAAFLAFGDFLAFGLGEALGLFFDLRDLTDFFLDAGLLALGLLADGDDFETTRKVLAWPAAGASTPFSTPFLSARAITPFWIFPSWLASM